MWSKVTEDYYNRLKRIIKLSSQFSPTTTIQRVTHHEQRDFHFI